MTEGENILTRFGMTLDEEPFSYEWVWYGICFAVGAGLIATLASVFFLSIVRFETGKSLATDMGDMEEEPDLETEEVAIPFTKVNITFKDMRYAVTASTSNEKLELLKGIDGVVEAGKMTALMVNSQQGLFSAVVFYLFLSRHL